MMGRLDGWRPVFGSGVDFDERGVGAGRRSAASGGGLVAAERASAAGRRCILGDCGSFLAFVLGLCQGRHRAGATLEGALSKSSEAGSTARLPAAAPGTEADP
jgi:hypothetical protein